MSSVDVVIPCFQYGRFLRDSVDSVLRQDVGALRVLIIDNGSTDNSLAVARQLARDNPSVEVVAHKRNLGPTASLNEGIDWAKADYFMTLDADDLLAPGCVKRAVSVMDGDDSIVFCHGAERFITGDETIDQAWTGSTSDCDWATASGEAFISRLCSKAYNLVANPTVVRRTKVQKAVGYYYPELKYADDMNMWMRLAIRGRVAETSAVQGIRRIHPGQQTQSYRDAPVRDLIEHLNNFEHFFCHEGRELPAAPRDRARMLRRTAFNGLYAAGALMLQGRLKQSLPCIRFSMTTCGGLLGPSRRRTFEVADATSRNGY